jgi:hypothetical protein
MPERTPLPPDLANNAFRVARARRGGVGEGRLRNAGLARPFHGIRVAGGTTDTVVERCRAYAPLLHHWQFFSHVTAAHLWDCPLPLRFRADDPLDVCTRAPFRAPRSRGVRGHQVQGDGVATDDRYGLPCADAATTWCQLAAILALEDLVAAGDSLLLDPVVPDPADRRPFLTLDRLTRRAEGFVGRGARAIATALPLLRPGAESRPESLLRLMLQRAGLPEADVNGEIRDDAGRFLGRADLVFRPWRTIVEYDGDQHRTSSRQYDRDVTRIEDFAQERWAVVRVRSRGLFVTPEDTVRRVERGLRSRGWRP